MPEKALKGRALSKQTEFGRQETIQPFTTMKVTELYGGKPFVEISFKSPSPVPLEDRDVDSLNPQEMRELLRLQKERERAAKKVKRELGHRLTRSIVADGDADDDDEVSFAASGPSKRAKLPATVNDQGVETIHLT
ncbi:hypothetical protein BU23DRAFT_570717 [Bimuria novae-zelandiae CBS 107.79]|uniref:DUF7918 domain-containing protein n=1 Tax=Bimuria novae-zelandiae CBS 107.79 TaxID=1447943 RepID=A0A6A5V107_9PLEO|nr:hypothetical protein BU23DRAFT_570717 [Bimuria novae-zelandiae CBS 107.79]